MAEFTSKFANNQNRIFLLPFGAFLTLSATVAAETGSTDSASLEEIVVTAQKREESLQTVPIAITAYSQEALDLMGAASLGNVQQSTPNLDFAQQVGGQNTTRVTLRGVGTETLVGGGDPGVALHIDGVYVGRNSAAAIDIFDVERLEILRGPQGTLYGRNANGGSINVITRRPADTLSAEGDVTLGNYDWVRARGTANVPLGESVAARLSVFSDKRDGYMENLWKPGQDGGDKDSQGARLQLQWKTTGGDTLLLRGFMQQFGGVGAAQRPLGRDLPTADGYSPSFAIGLSRGPAPPAGANILADAYRRPAASVGAPVLPLPTNVYQMRKNAPEYIDQELRGIDFEGNWQIGDTATLRAISSYQTNDNTILADSDNSEMPLETRLRSNDANQLSHELNLISSAEGRSQWILGAYYYRERLTETFTTVSPPGLVPATVPLPPGAIPGGSGVRQNVSQDYQTESYALFTQTTYALTDALRLTAGLRYTWDDKAQDRKAGGRVDATTGILFNVGTVSLDPAVKSSKTFKSPTGKLVLDYTFDNSNMVYASYSRGSKAGGFDFNAALVAGTLPAYEPEKINAYEIGSKNRLLDDTFQVNVSAFQYDYTNLQTFRLTNFGPRTDNAAESTIRGVEAALQWIPTRALRIDASIGYLDATYDKFFIELPPPGVDYSGKTLNNAPKWTLHTGLQYQWPVGRNSLLARVDWSYKDDIYFDRANTPLDMQKAYSLINGRIRYDAEEWFVDVFGNNLGDTTYFTAQLINPPFNCGCRTVGVGAPKMYGATVGFRF